MEQWLPIEGYEGRYEVSDEGRVRSLGWEQEITDSIGRTYKRRRRPFVMKPSPNTDGYLEVKLHSDTKKSKAFAVHRLVYRAFVGEIPKGMHVRHHNGKLGENRLDNLLLGTPLENIHDKFKHGTMAKGETNGASKLSEAQVREVKARLRAGESAYGIAKLFGVSKQNIQHIQHGRSWSWLK